MPIDEKQREKNTLNKHGAAIDRAYTKPMANPAGSQGRKAQVLVSAARALGMDDGSGSHDYSGSKAEHQANAIKLRAGGRHHPDSGLKVYGTGHDMSVHGEGKPYGSK